MEFQKKGILIVLSGPSGAGKDSVLNEIFKKKRKDIELSISYTTRDPRPGEIDKKDYYFVSKKDFLEIANTDGMLEYAIYCDNYYGTPIFKIEENLSAGKNVILEIEVQGALQVMEKRPDAVSIFIAPPSVEELESRLSKRGLDSYETIKRRLNKAKKEMEFAKKYSYVVINNDLIKCANEVLNIINKESDIAKSTK